MLPGTAKPEYRQHPPKAWPTADAPPTEATKITTHATIHASVNGMATAERIAGSTAVI